MKAFPSKRPVIKHLGKFGPIEFKPIIEDGMDLRDYFAAKAMQSLIIILEKNNSGDFTDGIVSDLTKIAYSYADSMMEERT